MGPAGTSRFCVCVSLSWAALATAQQSPPPAQATPPSSSQSTQPQTEDSQPQTRQPQRQPTLPLAYDIPPELYRQNPESEAARRRWNDGRYDAPPEPEAEPRVWYGWETLVVDGVALAAIFASAQLGTDDAAGPVFLAGFGGYLLGPPTVHFSHGYVGKGFASLGIRSIGPLVVVAAASCRHDDACLSIALLGLGIMPVAIAVDAAVLAYEAPEAENATHDPDNDGVGVVTPWFDPQHEGMGLMIASEFDL